jgi:hypothetical protein
MADEIVVTVADETNQAITASSLEAKEGYIRETFTNKTGANQVLSLGSIFRANSLTAFLNGILMEKDVDYTEGVNRNALTVLNTLVATDKIEVRYVVN